MSSDSKRYQSNEWTINLKLICEAAARNERKAISSCLNDVKLAPTFSPPETSSKVDIVNIITGQKIRKGVKRRHPEDSSDHNQRFSLCSSIHLTPSTQITSTLLHLLFFPTSTIAQKHKESFSNVLLLDSPPLHQSDVEEIEKQQKFQVLMSFRSLLFISPRYATPWDAIMTFVTVVRRKCFDDFTRSKKDLKKTSEERNICSLLIYYSFVDKEFNTAMFSDIREFLKHERLINEMNLMKRGNDYNAMEAVKNILVEIFRTAIQILFQDEIYDDDHGQGIINHEQLDTLIEISILLMETGHALDTSLQITSNSYDAIISEMMNALFPKNEMVDDDGYFADNENVCLAISSIDIELVLPLFSFCGAISNHMTTWHWEYLRNIVYKTIQLVRHDTKAFLIFPQIFKTLIAFIHSGDDSMNNISNSTPTWTEILVEIYYLAREEGQCFIEIEKQFTTTITQMSSQRCKEVVNKIIKFATVIHSDDIERFDKASSLSREKVQYIACSNLLFTIASCQLNATDTHTLILESFQKEENSIRGYETLLLMLSLNGFRMDQFAQLQDVLETDHDHEKLRFCFKGIFYQCDGIIKEIAHGKVRQDYMAPLARFVKLMHSILFFTNTEIAISRVEMFLNVASSILEDVSDHDTLDVQKIMLSASILINIFGDFESSRQIIIHRFSETFCEKGYGDRSCNSKRKSLYCSILFTFSNTLDMMKSSNVTKVFQPLSNILYHSEDRKVQVNPDILSNLIGALSWNSKCREGLISEQIMSSINNNLECMVPRFSGKEDINAIAIDSLLSLIQHRNMYPVDKMCVEALTYIIRMILLNRPEQTSRSRSMLFDKLNLLVEQHYINSWVSSRLWAALTIKLLQYFQITSSRRLVFVPSKEWQESNFTSSLKLATTLMMINSEEQSQINQQKFTEDEIEVVFDTRRLEKLVEADNSVNLRLINLICYTSMIEYASDDSYFATKDLDDQSKSSIHDSDSNSKAPYDIRFLQAKIFRDECKTIEDIIESNNKVPFWSEFHDLDFMKAEEFDSSHIHTSSESAFFDSGFYTMLASLLLEILGAITQHPNQITDDDNSGSRRILWLFESITLLLCEKCESAPSDSTVTPRYFLCATKIIQIILVRKDALGSQALVPLKKFMSSFNTFCSALQSYSEACLQHCKMVPLMINIETIHAMWTYYNLSCNEIACCNVLDYIESCLADNTRSKRIHNSEEISCFSSSESSFDFIRAYRESFLSSFGSVFQLFEERDVWEMNKSDQFTFCTVAACTLTFDLCSGFKAVSGGLTKPLFSCYVQTIEDVLLSALKINTIHAIHACSQEENSVVFDWQQDCYAASKDLWNAICTNDVKNFHVLKLTLRICLTYFPRLCWRIDRITLSNFSLINCRGVVNEKHKFVDYHPLSLLEKCIKCIGNHSDLESINSGSKSNDEDMESLGLSKILKSSKRMLEWTHDYSLQATEQLWSEVVSILNDEFNNSFTPRIPDTYQVINSGGRMNLISHTLRRQYIMKLSLSSIILQISVLIQSDQRDSDKIQFFSLIERRTCTCLEKILITLKASIKLLTQDEFDGHMLLKLSEAMACVRAWLIPTDLVDLICRYYTDTSDSTTIKTSNLINTRISKIIHKTEEVEKAQRELRQSLGKAKKTNNDIDYLFYEHFDDYKHTKGLVPGECTSLVQLLDEYNYCDFSQLSQRSNATAENGKQKNSKIITKTVNQKRLREARRDKRRSRNNVIDEWMYLDCELDEERNNEAYEDLEDFIVPG